MMCHFCLGWYKDGVEAGIQQGAAAQKAEDDIIIQKMNDKLKELTEEIEKLKAQLNKLIIQNDSTNFCQILLKKDIYNIKEV